jgi:hypothetical protein
VHSDSRSPMLDTINKLTEPTACSLLDGTGINMELVLAKVFLFQKACHSVPMCGPMQVTTLCLYQLMGVTYSNPS